MRFKRIIPFLAVAAGIIYFLRASFFATPETPPLPSPRAGNLPVPALAAPLKTEPVKPKNVVVPPKGRFGEGLVPFKVVDGMAIAYGDVVLGSPDDPNVANGYAEPVEPSPWDGPQIPYGFVNGLQNPERLPAAFAFFAGRTPVTFVPWTDQPDYLVFQTTAENCFSALGKVGGPQPIMLSKKCGPREIAHEIMHALGFIHQQSRADRDKFIEVLWPNILKDYQSQFEIAPDVFMKNERDTPFDYRSIMVYRATSFAVSSDSKTMRSKTNLVIDPSSDRLSDGDVKRINDLFPGEAR